MLKGLTLIIPSNALMCVCVCMLFSLYTSKLAAGGLGRRRYGEAVTGPPPATLGQDLCKALTPVLHACMRTTVPHYHKSLHSTRRGEG